MQRIPIKIGVWGNFTRKESGAAARVYIEEIFSKEFGFSFKIHQEYEDNYFDSWNKSFGGIFFLLHSEFLFESWEDNPNEKPVITKFFVYEKPMFIVGSPIYRGHTFKFYTFLSDEEDEVEFDIPLNTKGYGIEVFNQKGQEVAGEVFYSEENVQLFLNRYDINLVTFEGYFNIRIQEKANDIRQISTRRPLLVREKTELDFLQKIQAADTLEALQSIENELNSTATDPVLIQQLLHNVSEKKAFY